MAKSREEEAEPSHAVHLVSARGGGGAFRYHNWQNKRVTTATEAKSTALATTMMYAKAALTESQFQPIRDGAAHYRQYNFAVVDTHAQELGWPAT